MLYRWLASAVVGAHFGYLAYLVGGGYLAWRWPRTFALHLAAVIWAVLLVAAYVECPLTSLQNALRVRGGEHPLAGSFLNTYARGVFYPAGHQAATQGVVALIVAISWIGLAARLRHHQSPPMTSTV